MAVGSETSTIFFSPYIFGEDFQFDSYFSDGLIQKPPTKWHIYLASQASQDHFSAAEESITWN